MPDRRPPSRPLRIRLFHIWFLMRRPMTLGVRAIAVDARGDVLLVRHTYQPGWHLPGGGVEPGETALQCLRRELAEEGNAQTGPAIRLHGFHYNPAASRRDHVAVYVCEGIVQTGPKQADREIAEARFFALSDLPEGLGQASARRLDEWRSGASPDPLW